MSIITLMKFQTHKTFIFSPKQIHETFKAQKEIQNIVKTVYELSVVQS